MIMHVTIQGSPWTIRNGSWFGWPIRLAAATTMSASTVFGNGWIPDSLALAHEFYHRRHTSWLRYFFSWSIGRLWKSDYWKGEERAANAYGTVHSTDPDFIGLSQQYAALMPKGTAFVSIDHPV